MPLDKRSGHSPQNQRTEREKQFLCFSGGLPRVNSNSIGMSRVDRAGFEPATFRMPCERSTN